MTLTERLHAAAKPYLTGWRYGHKNCVAYPWPAGVRGPAVAVHDADREIDCVGLSASVVMRMYPEARWTQQDLADLFVYDIRRPQSPIDAVVRAGVGEEAPEGAPEALFLLQGWRTPHTGHAVLAFDRGTGVLDVLESTSRESLRGPRWRTSTWVRLHAEFPAALYLARLLP